MATKKYLDYNGLGVFKTKIINEIPTKTSDLTNDSGYISSETDPTVPSWAKQSTKPSYEANEISYSIDAPTVVIDDSNFTNVEEALYGLTVQLDENVLDLNDQVALKQDALVSGTNIKTINNQSILGSGNISISSGGTATDVQINGTSIVSNNVANITTNAIANLIYPVGSIYMSVNNTNPSTLFGGTWVQIKDTFLLSAGDTYNAGDTGGSSTHTLTIDEMPSHNHIVKPYYGGIGNGSALQRGWSGSSTSQDYTTTNTGGGQAFDIMPPYLTVYMWKRTA